MNVWTHASKSVVSLVVPALAGGLALSVAQRADAAPFFESVWGAATGTDEIALTDGGAWDRWETNAPTLVEIRPIDGADVPAELAGTNMAAVGFMGIPNWSMVTKENVGTDTADDVYWRMYLRVSSDPGPQWGSVHPFQDFEDVDGSRSENFYLGLSTRNPDRTGWAPYFSSYVAQPETEASTFALTEDEAALFLATDKWYRVEGHLEFLERRGGVVATHYEIRFFDPQGDPDVPVLTSDDFVATNCSGSCYGRPLSEFYDDGARFFFRSTSTTFTIGNNGPAESSGEGHLYDVTAVALATDDWIGPYDGGVDGGSDSGESGGDAATDDGAADDSGGTGDGVASTGDNATDVGAETEGVEPAGTDGSESGAGATDSTAPEGCACRAQPGPRRGPGAGLGLLLLGLWGLRRQRCDQPPS